MKTFMDKIDSFMKVLTLIIVIHGLFMITWTYVLASLGSTEIVEELSQTIVAEIIAPTVIYGLTKTVENVFKYNEIFNSRGDVSGDSEE